MSTTEPSGQSGVPLPADAAPAYSPAKDKPKQPPITGGQRASAILAGIAGNVLFAIGWFGVTFVLFGALFGGLVNDLLVNLVGDEQAAAQFTGILNRASALVWLVGMVFFVGSLAFIVFGFLSSQAILRRGDVDKPGRVNWFSILIVAVVDLPVFFFALWLATLVTDDSAGLLWLPPLLALLLSAGIGLAVWWLMAHANRGKPEPKPEKPGKARKSEKA